MILKKIFKWIDEYFSRDEREIIKQLKQQNSQLTNELNQLKQEQKSLKQINEKLSESNKKLIDENAALKKEIENNNTKAKYYDLICKVVEDDVLKQMIELSNKK